MFSKFRLAAAALGLVLSVTNGFAQDVTKIRFSLDWKLQGIHAWFLWAQEKGYFAQEKLDARSTRARARLRPSRASCRGLMTRASATPMP